MTDLDPLARLAQRQHGTFSRDQAHAVGVTESRLRREVARGSLVRLGPHTFRSALTPPSALGDLVALLLDVGEPCWVAGRSAGALHRFDGFVLRPPFHVLVLDDRRVRRTPAVVHRTKHLELIDRARVDGIPVTSAARTVIDLAADQPTEVLAAAYDSGLRDGRFSEDLFHRRFVALRGRGRSGTPKLLDVIEGRERTRGGHSWLEREFLRRCAEAGLPRPLTQQVLAKGRGRLVRVDCLFERQRVVVELLGYRYHRTPAHLSRDAERLNALLLAGFLPLQFSYDHVVGDPLGTIATVRSALVRAS